MIKNLEKKGITLIEVIVYLAIFGIFFTTIMQFYFSLSEYNRLASERSELQKSIILIDQHLNQSIKEADSIDDANSLFNNPDGILRFTLAGGYYEYNIINSRLNFDNNGTDFYLIDPQQVINSFTVSAVEDSDEEIVGVKIVLEISYANNPNLTEYLDSLYIL